MRKIVILLLVCSVLPIQAQYADVVQQREMRSKRFLQEAKLLYNERNYDMAEELLHQVQNGNPTHIQEHEAAALLALIAYYRNPEEALGTIEEYLKLYPDAPEQNRM